MRPVSPLNGRLLFPQRMAFSMGTVLGIDYKLPAPAAAGDRQPGEARPACAAASVARWPSAWEPARGRWTAPVTAMQVTALVALGDSAGLGRLWESLSPPGQVNVFAALAFRARAGACQAERLSFPSSRDLSALQGTVCPGILAGAVAALAHREWEIPACTRCLRAAAEAVAELDIANWQAVIPVTREAIAHVLSWQAGRILATW